MGDQKGLDFNGASTGDDYCILPDGRVPLWVMLTVGDDDHCVTPWHPHSAPLILSAAAIGREFTAAGSRDEPLHGFLLAHDPRL